MPAEAKLLFVFRPSQLNPGVTRACREGGAEALFDLGGVDPAPLAGALRQAEAQAAKLPLGFFLGADLEAFLDASGLGWLWIEHHHACRPDLTPALTERMAQVAATVDCQVVTGDLDWLGGLIQDAPPRMGLALKGSEAAGLTGAESLSVLYSFAEKRLAGRENAPGLAVWGGVWTPEGAAAFLGSGARAVVCESLHWLTSLGGASEQARERLAGLRLDGTALLGQELGLGCRVLDRGNSRAADDLGGMIRAWSRDLGPAPARRALARYLRDRAVHPLDSALGGDELIPLGVEATAADGFAARYGRDTAQALAGFQAAVDQALEQAPQVFAHFKVGQAADGLGARLPILQGAMSSITDSLDFARAVAQAGALPTLALGWRDPAGLPTPWHDLARSLEGSSFAVNIVALPENTFREAQIRWVIEHRPPLVVIGAGEPSLVGELCRHGLRAAYLAPDEGLLALALQAGADWVILEGQEAGGHVGVHSTLTLAQMALELRRRRPELFASARVVLAGGIHDGSSAWRAAMLGAQAVQMGTAYLATREIVSTGALSPLYQSLLLDSPPGGTRVAGAAAGLGVRALDTPLMARMRSLEDELAGGKVEEGEFRRRLEQIAAGSLHLAARGRRKPDGPDEAEAVCLDQGQFMAGAAAGNLDRALTLGELHAGVMAGLPPLVAAHARPRPVSAAVRRRAQPGQPRLAVTGLALANSLGASPSEIWRASLACRCGIKAIDASRWDHARFYDPDPARLGKTCCPAGAFLNLNIDRAELGLPPQDFLAMSHSTRLTLWLAQRALADSGLPDEVADPARMGIIISQNAGECASTLTDLLVSGDSHRLADEVGVALSLTPDQRARARAAMNQGRVGLSDSSLLGRLNSLAGGYISRRFGLQGPCFAVTAACATSLVALYLAAQMVRAGLLDAVLVGGGEELLTPGFYLEFSALGALAGGGGRGFEPAQLSRPFDALRDGFVPGEGGAMVVVESEALARRRGARVHAYVSGVGASNNHLGLVESVASTQQAAMTACFRDAGHGPEEVGLVECHATATKQGDVEEASALKGLYPRGGGVRLAAFKSQIGHTVGASGLTSLVRAIMAMQAGVHPPSLNHDHPDPALDFTGWGFRIPGEPEDWPATADHPRRAQVNAFGFGGANYVALLEESREGSGLVMVPTQKRELGGSATSAHDPLEGLGVHLLRVDIGGRAHLLAVEAARRDEARRKLSENARWLESAAADPAQVSALAQLGLHLAPASAEEPPLAIVFSGQGSYYPGMGRELYQALPAFRARVDRLAAAVAFDLRGLMLNPDSQELLRTQLQQPALFVLETALAGLLMDLGLEPVGTAGHSLGELSALTLAGAMTPEQGLGLVVHRAKCMADLAQEMDDAGAMLATDAPLVELERALAGRDDLHLACFNAPDQTVVSGSTNAVRALHEGLRDQGHASSLLRVSMAFHTPALHALRQPMQQFMENLPVTHPVLPVLSNVTGRPHPSDPQGIKDLLADHLPSPVRWLDEVRLLHDRLGARMFLEAGPRDTLCAMVESCLPGANCLHLCHPEGELMALRHAVIKLYLLGCLDTLRAGHYVDFDSHPTASGHDHAPDMDDRARKVDQVVGRRLGRLLGRRLGDLLRPELLKALRDEIDPNYTEQELEAYLHGTEPRHAHGTQTPGAAATVATSPPSAEEDSASDAGGELLEAVVAIIMEATGYQRHEIEAHMDLRQHLSIRSSRLPVIMDAAERRFGIPMDILEFREVRTVGQMAQRIKKLMEQAAAPLEAAPGPTIQPESRYCQGEQSQGSEPAMTQGGPLYRLVFGATPLPGPPGPALKVTPGSTVIMLAGAGSALAGQAQVYLESTLGAVVVRGRADELRDRLGKGDHPAGLVMVEDGHVAREVQDAQGFLRECFGLLKAFTALPEKRFCLCLSGSDMEAAVAAEGVLGMLLAAAHEYPSMLWRWGGLDDPARTAEVLACMLDPQVSWTAMSFRGGRSEIVAASPQAGAVGLGPAMAPLSGEVVVVSGGARGVTSYLARALAGLGCRLALLGRTSQGIGEGGAAGEEVVSSLREIEAMGAEAMYLACDVVQPDQVKQALDQVAGRWGAVHGIVHGAGVLADAFMQMLTQEEFARVMAVKLDGAVNLHRAAAGRGLRFLVGLSSVAAALGNLGQAAYCAANRALAAQLRLWHERDGLLTKTLWLPPLAGAGMAADPEVLDLLAARGWSGGMVHAREMAAWAVRELAAAPADDDWVMPLRLAPPARTMPLSLEEPAPAPDLLRVDGLAWPRHVMPLVDEALDLDLVQGRLTTSRIISHRRDPWLPDHHPMLEKGGAVLPGVMAGEAMLEAARLLCPHLTPAGLVKVRFREALPCPAVGEVKMTTRCRLVKETSGRAICETELISDQHGQTVVHVQAKVILSAARTASLQPVLSLEGEDLSHGAWSRDVLRQWYEQRGHLGASFWLLETVTGIGAQGIRGTVMQRRREDDDGLGCAHYQYEPWLLEALLHLANRLGEWHEPRNTAPYLPVEIEEVVWGRRSRPGEELVVEGCRREHGRQGSRWDGQVLDSQNELLLRVRGLTMIPSRP